MLLYRPLLLQARHKTKMLIYKMLESVIVEHNSGGMNERVVCRLQLYSTVGVEKEDDVSCITVAMQ